MDLGDILEQTVILTELGTERFCHFCEIIVLTNVTPIFVQFVEPGEGFKGPVQYMARTPSHGTRVSGTFRLNQK